MILRIFNILKNFVSNDLTFYTSHKEVKENLSQDSNLKNKNLKEVNRSNTSVIRKLILKKFLYFLLFNLEL